LVALRKTNEVAAYVRASMDRKGDRWTVDTQLRKIRALAEAKDWNVVEVYEDNAVSATKKRRAGTRWAEMLDDARAGRFSMVVAVDMDRLLRSTKDLNTLIDLGLRVGTVPGGGPRGEGLGGGRRGHGPAAAQHEGPQHADRSRPAGRHRGRRDRPFDGRRRVPGHDARRAGPVRGATQGRATDQIERAPTCRGYPHGRLECVRLAVTR